MRPDDLRGSARQAYDTWRRLGLSEQSAMNALVEDGVIRLSDDEKLARRFRNTFGLSEAEARRAVDGQDGPSVRRVSEVAGRSAARPEPGDAWRLVAKIEEFASDLCRRGVPEEEAVRTAAFAVFEAAPDSLQDWVAAVAGRRWPGLWGAKVRAVAATSTALLTGRAGRSAGVSTDVASTSPRTGP